MNQLFQSLIGEIKERTPPSDGIPYRVGEKGYAEPTLLCILGLIAQDAEKEFTNQLWKWISDLQNPDGSLANTPETPKEGPWLTPHFAIAARHLGLETSKNKAVQFLLSFKSVTFQNTPDNELDAGIVGWPWARETFGWVEPTAWAILALQMNGLKDHERVKDGRRLLKDRYIPENGWNTGSKKVFNNQLLPFWDTTSIAALALGEEEAPFLESVLKVLENGLKTCDSLYSCAWGCICLEAFGFQVATLKTKIITLLERASLNEMNLGHLGMALIALSSKKVLTL